MANPSRLAQSRNRSKGDGAANGDKRGQRFSVNVPAEWALILIHVEFARKIRSQHEKCRCDR